MREIRFRIWCPKTKTFVIYGMNPLNLMFGVLQSSKLADYINDNNCVWQQFTGLKDAGGREIYEGDFVTAPAYGSDIGYLLKYEVVFWNGAFRLDCPNHTHGGMSLYTHLAHTHVVGHVFEEVEQEEKKAGE